MPHTRALVRDAGMSFSRASYVSLAFVTAAGAAQGRYTPQRARLYEFRAAVRLAARVVDQQPARIYLAKNGALYKGMGQLHTSGITGQTIQPAGSAWAEANGTTDYFEILMLHTYGSDQTFGPGADETWFQGMLARTL